jgi:hypothetical protein
MQISPQRLMGFELQPLPRAALPVTGTGEVSKQLGARLRSGAVTTTSTAADLELVPTPTKTAEERLFDSRIQLKVLAAQVAMHLTGLWRTRLFEQLDSLLDPSEWVDGDGYPQVSSWWTFLRAMLHTQPARRPGLGLTKEGYLVGAWDVGSDQLTLTFLPRDEIRWTVSCVIDGVRERISSNTQVTRLATVLAPYGPERWFELGPATPPA